MFKIFKKKSLDNTPPKQLTNIVNTSEYFDVGGMVLGNCLNHKKFYSLDKALDYLKS